MNTIECHSHASLVLCMHKTAGAAHLCTLPTMQPRISQARVCWLRLLKRHNTRQRQAFFDNTQHLETFAPFISLAPRYS